MLLPALPAGLEPHSSLPVAVPAVFGSESPLLPAALRGNCHGLASSVVRATAAGNRCVMRHYD